MIIWYYDIIIKEDSNWFNSSSFLTGQQPSSCRPENPSVVNHGVALGHAGPAKVRGISLTGHLCVGRGLKLFSIKARRMSPSGRCSGCAF